MNGNKIVIAILLGALCISAAIYFSGQQSTKELKPVPSISEESSMTVTPPIPSETIPVVEDDLTLITNALIKKTGISKEMITVTISKHIGNYAVGGITEKDAIGGAQWFAAKTGDGWVIVHDGQDYPTCSSLVGYDFPKEILTSCWDNTTNKVKSLF